MGINRPTLELPFLLVFVLVFALVFVLGLVVREVDLSSWPREWMEEVGLVLVAGDVAEAARPASRTVSAQRAASPSMSMPAKRLFGPKCRSES